MENQVVIDSKGRLATIREWLEPVLVLLILGSLFGYLGSQMGLSAMVNTLFNTAHQLLLNTVLFIMGITVLSGALSQLLSEFGVIRLLEVPRASLHLLAGSTGRQKLLQVAGRSAADVRGRLAPHFTR